MGRGSLDNPRTVAIAATLTVAAALWVALATALGDVHGHHAGPIPERVGTTASMWLLMMVAMMLPSAAPMIGAYAEVSSREAQGAPLVARVSVFTSGYLALWSGYALAAAGLLIAARNGAWFALGRGADITAVSGLLLCTAGIYQWFPVKNACLRHCRSPVAFLLAHWRGGTGGAFRLGLRHGAHCLGCCVALMGLMFVFGTLSLWGMAALALYCVAERNLPGVERWGRVVGAMLLGAGGLILARGWVW